MSTRSPSSRQAHQRFRARFKRTPETREFGKAASNQSRAGARAEAGALGNAAGDCEHVLGRAADFHAAYIGRAIEAERRGREALRDLLGDTFVLRGNGDSGGQSSRDIGSETRAGENGRNRLRYFLYKHFIEKALAGALDSLGTNHPRRTGARERTRGTRHLAKGLRRHDSQDEIGAANAGNI